MNVFLQNIVSFFMSIDWMSIDWGTWVSAIATVILAALTFIYVRLTKEILESQSDPCIIVSVVPDEERQSILLLVIKNVGSGLAQDIVFELSRPIPARAWGLSEQKAQISKTMDSGPLIDGIPALGPGEQRRITWGQYGGLIKSLGTESVIIKCKFKKKGKAMPPMECKLDIKSFEGTVAAERPIPKIAKELEKISKVLNHLASGFYKLKVQMVEEEELEAELSKEGEA